MKLGEAIPLAKINSDKYFNELRKQLHKSYEHFHNIQSLKNSKPKPLNLETKLFNFWK